jgi:hypothetical protein
MLTIVRTDSGGQRRTSHLGPAVRPPQRQQRRRLRRSAMVPATPNHLALPGGDRPGHVVDNQRFMGAARNKRRAGMKPQIVVLVVGALVALGLGLSIRVVKQYERGVLFRLGRVVGVRGRLLPGDRPGQGGGGHRERGRGHQPDRPDHPAQGDRPAHRRPCSCGPCRSWSRSGWTRTPWWSSRPRLPAPSKSSAGSWPGSS